MDVARYNVALTLHSSLVGMARQDESQADHVANICVAYRVPGICALLQNADTGGESTPSDIVGLNFVD